MSGSGDVDVNVSGDLPFAVSQLEWLGVSARTDRAKHEVAAVICPDPAGEASVSLIHRPLQGVATTRVGLIDVETGARDGPSALVGDGAADQQLGAGLACRGQGERAVARWVRCNAAGRSWQEPTHGDECHAGAELDGHRRG